MSDHYYRSQPEVESQERIIKAEMRGANFTFTADRGVFAKDSVDFGTKLLIETASIPSGARVLDLGCGYGPVGIAIARTVKESLVTMVDVNQRALKLASRNAKQNGVEHRISVIESDGLKELSDQSFDAILTNPPIRAGKETVHRLFAESYTYLRPGGVLWIVIRKQHGGPSAKARLEELFTVVERVEQKKGFWIVKAIKEDIN
ncbi:class I SAM-dependent methyltransferase [Marininema halotolerans]|uniref:16S rRNA (Guanine1207-N2)-methyltransferase n=1 Tax=Marininema halotolerans TaxID=1155944 RepID=A0A1I6T7H0_9BACL|nr:class I SAM-dependent methyltransferase [Marininema halotolerans]SFS85028.1 16S rRNA (guanine1207-N2)-methyltransferase [Marininema halotolerans]